MLRYTVLRLLIFFGSLSLLWLLGLRSDAQLPWLVVGGALLSMVISAIVLRPMREQYIADVTERLNRRRETKGADEEAEDAAVDRSTDEGGSADRGAAEHGASDRRTGGSDEGEEPEEYR